MLDSILDRLTFPETPEQMHAILVLEDVAKSQGSLTHHGMRGFIFASSHQLMMDRALYGFSVVDYASGKRIDPRSVVASDLPNVRFEGSG